MLITLGALCGAGHSTSSPALWEHCSAAIKALPPDDAAMTKYAGQQLTTGARTEMYANHFIAVHLKEIGGGKTYSRLSAESQANPGNTALKAQVDTIFRGPPHARRGRTAPRRRLAGLLLASWEVTASRW
jgi:hypothetical protein